MTSRCAILIGCPGPSHNFLRGVKQDLFNLRKYLRSDNGGAWIDEEITTLYDATLSDVFSAIQNSVADYVFVYFSGHGYTSAEGYRMVSLRDYAVSDVFLLNASPRQLIVVDACRNYESVGYGKFPSLEKEYYSISGPPVDTRELFDRAIRNSPRGKMIIHSTRPGYSSYDSVHGGYFTHALLTLATRLQMKEGAKKYMIDRMLPHVKTVLENRNNTQAPCIVYNDGNLLVPFTITAPEYEYVEENKGSNTGALVGLGLFALLLWGASNNGKRR